MIQKNKKMIKLIQFSMLYLLFINTSFAQISYSQFSSELDGNIYSFKVYLDDPLADGNNSMQFKATINLKIINTTYMPPSEFGSGVIKFKCLDVKKKKYITIFYKNSLNYLNGFGCNDYCGCWNCYFINPGVLNYIKKTYYF